MKRALKAAIIALGANLVAGCVGSPTFLYPASSVAADESELYKILLYLAAAVFLLVEVWLLYDVIRFRRRPNDDSLPKQIYANSPLEVVWTVIPLVVVAVIFGMTVNTVNTVAPPPAAQSDLNVHVVGHQWWWEFDYPDLGIQTANELHVPTGVRVQITLTSTDVIHSFWVPQLSGKMDVIPGQINHLWFQADQVGEYHGQCAEFCGLNHANMRIKVVVESSTDFQSWVANQQKPPAEPQTDLETKGFDLIKGGICSNCHTLGDNQAKQAIGPNLTHLFSRSVFAGATFDLTEDNIRRWLTENQTMKPGNDMNVTVTPDQANALMAYLKTLK